MRKLFISTALFGIALISGGCNLESYMAASSQRINNLIYKPADQELYTKDVSELLDKKVEQINFALSKGFPLHVNGSYHLIKANQIEDFSSELIKNVAAIGNEYATDKGNIEKNKNLLNKLQTTETGIKASIEKIDSYFQGHSIDFDQINNRGTSSDLGSYCKSTVQNKSLCINTIEGEEVVKTSNDLVPLLLKNRYAKIYPEQMYKYNRYNRDLIDSKKLISELSKIIADSSESSERISFLKESSKSAGLRFTVMDIDNGIFLSKEIQQAYFRPDKKTVYDLSDFKIIQSLKGGILLTPHNKNISETTIFLETDIILPDNYVFKPSEQWAYFTGIKEYKSATNSTKKVYAFKNLHEGKTTY
jgi:hypothetical protein